MVLGKKTFRMAAAALIAATMFIGLSPGRAADTMDMGAMVSQAKTKADHEALAAEYEKQADDAKAQSEQHRKLAESYKKMPALGKGIGDLPGMIKHCNGLAKTYADAAQHFTMMAKMEREVAAKVK